jgi:hypothetical protein
MPFDIQQILSQLDAEQAADSEAPIWLQESWTDPAGFIAALASASITRGALPLKSRPGQYYDPTLFVRRARGDPRSRVTSRILRV